MMKLYVYDHCPYCVRARMPFALKQIPFELIFLQNDDEATPINMIGKKMLPILEHDGKFMGESLDIVNFIDQLQGPQIFGGTPDPDIINWLTEWNSTINALSIPRTPDPVFAEFTTASARDYFTRKKSAYFGDFAKLIARTETFLRDMEQAFSELEPILPDGKTVGINDIFLFPMLRYLSILPDIKWPDIVNDYAQTMAERSGVPLISTLRDLKKTETFFHPG